MTMFISTLYFLMLYDNNCDTIDVLLKFIKDLIQILCGIHFLSIDITYCVPKHILWTLRVYTDK